MNNQNEDEKYRRVFFVCFRRTNRWRWWHLFAGNKRQHIFLITSCINNNCVMIDMSEGGCGIYAFDEPAETIARNVVERGEEVIRYLVEEESMQAPRIKFFRTCVGMAKDFLGINKWWIITPQQLYKELSNG